MFTVPIENQQPSVQQWGGNQSYQGRYSLFTCALLLDTETQKCFCQASKSDPTLLTQIAAVSDHHIQVSRPGLLGMSLSTGREISQFRWGERSEALSVWVPLFCCGHAYNLPPALIYSLSFWQCPVWWLFSVFADDLLHLISVCFPDFLLLSLSWLVFYLQSDFWVPAFLLVPLPSWYTLHSPYTGPVTMIHVHTYLRMTLWAVINCILKSSQRSDF